MNFKEWLHLQEDSDNPLALSLDDDPGSRQQTMNTDLPPADPKIVRLFGSKFARIQTKKKPRTIVRG